MSVSFFKRACLLLVIAGLSSCSFVEYGRPNYGPTLADLDEAEIPDDPMPVPPANIDKIEESYRSALEVAKDPGVRHQILVRLADLEMARSEERQLTATEQQEFFDGAVNMYEELIKLNRERPVEGEQLSNERLLYQLSKAYALDGKLEESNAALNQLVREYPQSGFAAEAEFRSAEKAFSDGDYKLAETLYAQVMAAGATTPFYENAVYMHGWSQFKRSRYRASIKSFTEVLDLSLKEGEGLKDLTNSQRNMVADTLRVMAIVFSYLDGAQSITEIYNNLGQRHYKHLLYMRLGDLYLEQKRYRDSADTYRHYVQFFPNTDYSPTFSVKAIEVYTKGDFPSLILPAKEEYVRNYGAYSQYWAERNEEQRALLKSNLQLYLDELSSFYHARALQRQQAAEKYLALTAQGKKPKVKPEPALPDFIKAADLYNEFVYTFPKDKKTPEMHFLMGEALYEAGNKPDAVKAYETVAYTYLDEKRGAEAGYAALVALGELINETQTPEKIAEWKNHKINSGISFADYYPNDERAAAVLTKSAQEIFELGDLKRASEVATRITTWQPAPERNLRKTAWLVVAHSRFDTEQFADAELAYRTVLTLLPEENTKSNIAERQQVIDRIAASMYRISEQLVTSEDLPSAVTKLLQIRDVAPGTEIAISAQYDAATHLIALKDWAQAEVVLKDFEQRYPQHKLTQTLPPKLALIYQESEQWDKAAAALAVMAKSGDPEVRRQSLYLSAELYEKSDKISKAILQYRSYANNYPDPFNIATEARYKLVELYGKTGDVGKRNFWLKKLITEDARAGAKRTDRSRYLAAFASNKFADDEYDHYEKIKIALPLKKSMQKKKKALDVTLKAYKKVMDFGVAEFATKANYKIGMIYSQLSQDLMNSQRPKGLDALALEQYEILLEEQAFPFEEKAIEIHSSNAERAWSGLYDDGVKQSFDALAKLLPARYGKKEEAPEVSRDIY